MKEIDFEHLCYASWQPNEPLKLRKDIFTIELNAKKYSGEAEVWVRLLPKAKLEIKTKLSNGGEFGDFLNTNNARFYIGKNSVEIPGFFTSISGDSMTWVPKSEPIFLDHGVTSINLLTFHLFNFINFIGMRRSIVMHWGDWKIEIRSLTSTVETFKYLKEKGGYGLTHVGCLRKSNGDLLSDQDAKNIMEALRYFFSFANGSQCSPVVFQGFDDDCNKIWESWNSPDEPWHEKVSWLNHHNMNQLADLFPLFMDKWEDESWRAAFHDVIYWYLRSNFSSHGIDVGIILTQTAIERLSFEYAVQYKKLISSEGFKKLWASDKFRLLFSSLEIPIDIPIILSKMHGLAQKSNFSDAPHILTELRNLLVHPDNKSKINLNEIICDTWNLGLWYLEMTLLRLCGYDGKYHNRLKLGLGWDGEEESVPWNKNVSNK
ncbi:MAG: hypothetical protein PVH61_18235 [Candidatus Aminicenantes bacterium]|jgi:hypothetical protein